ncbi:MAG: hypothetical protein HRT44_06405 [Bdellovibrionales bacterium]|nr:hypothetical protein [Bdellovibrionales bacterium]NQZ18872.1 hypothetical protein [Bdellovibrionales bacterium]
MKKILIILASLIMASSAWGSIVFAPGLIYESVDTENNGVSSSSDRLNLDLKFGYVLPMGLYLGGMYNMDQYGDDLEANSIGATVGYYSMMGFYSLFTYHFMGERDVNATTKYTGAAGPQIDIGWVFPLSSFFAIGPQLSYKSLEFSKIEVGSVETDTNDKRTVIEPSVSLWFMF